MNKRGRYIKAKSAHYCLLVNKQAAGYNPKYINKLTASIRRKKGYFSVFEPSSERQLYFTALRTLGLQPWPKGTPQTFKQRGKVTGIIACGGDGTFNIVARAALKANMPIGILPMGKNNDITRSFYGDDHIENAIKHIINNRYILVDGAKAGKLIFFGSIGTGLMPSVANYFNENNHPRFGFGWQKATQRILETVKPDNYVIKLDAFRFEAKSSMVQINLLPTTCKLNLSNASKPDDEVAEVIFDINGDQKTFSTYLKKIVKDKYVYGADIRMYRGERIVVEGVNGKTLLVDGEKIKYTNDSLDIQFLNRKLKVLKK